eukprot:7308292-Pyramimonas_sp.AAC.1
MSSREGRSKAAPPKPISICSTCAGALDMIERNGRTTFCNNPPPSAVLYSASCGALRFAAAPFSACCKAVGLQRCCSACRAALWPAVAMV